MEGKGVRNSLISFHVNYEQPFRFENIKYQSLFSIQMLIKVLDQKSIINNE